MFPVCWVVGWVTQMTQNDAQRIRLKMLGITMEAAWIDGDTFGKSSRASRDRDW